VTQRSRWYRSIHPSISISIYLSIHPSISIYLSVCLSVCRSVGRSVGLSVYVYVHSPNLGAKVLRGDPRYLPLSLYLSKHMALVHTCAPSTGCGGAECVTGDATEQVASPPLSPGACLTCTGERCCEQHRPRTTRRAPHVYPDI